MSYPVILSLGEVLWDVFPDKTLFGGAPVNFAAHACALGAKVSILSAVGSDPLGHEALQELKKRGVDTSLVQAHPTKPTGSVKVSFDPAGKPHYDIVSGSAWDDIQLTDCARHTLSQADVVYYGTLSQRSEASASTIRQLLQATGPQTLRVCDINLRPPFHTDAVISASVALADVLKISDEELDTVARACAIPPGTPLEQLKAIRAKYDLQLIALTRGPDGALLVTADAVSDAPGVKVKVADTVGAGDSFIAALITGYCRKTGTLDELNRHACRVAAYVCSQPGATPQLPDELTRAPLCA